MSGDGLAVAAGDCRQSCTVSVMRAGATDGRAGADADAGGEDDAGVIGDQAKDSTPSRPSTSLSRPMAGLDIVLSLKKRPSAHNLKWR